MKAAIFCNNGAECPVLNGVFAPYLKARIEAQAQLLPYVVTQANFAGVAPEMREVEVIFATWGLWPLSPAQREALPNLKAVFYAAGSVKHFALPLLERGVLVTSSWQANAVPVAEFTLAQILLANKGYWRNQAEYRGREDYGAFRGRGNYRATIALLGAGQVGRRVIELLRPFHLRVVVFDPYLSTKGAEHLGVEKVESLHDAFAAGDAVSNHLADIPATIGLIRGHHMEVLPQNATFINTGRGRTVDHDALLKVFGSRTDLTAVLDVTDPEPLPLAHPLRALPNVHLTNHIAGSIGEEVSRMGQIAVEEFEAWQLGRPLRYAITPEMLDTMA